MFLYIPKLIFGKLLTSDNFNDDQKRITDMISSHRKMFFFKFYLFK